MGIIRACRHWTVVLAMGASLSACVLNPPAPATERVARSPVDAFSLSGRLSVTDGTRSATGRLDWQRRPGTDRWTIFSPLGQIVAQIDSGPDGAELVLANGERQVARQVADLVPAILPGAAEVGLPPGRLADWIQAAPPSNAEVRTLDSVGRPARVIDQGWIIDYLSYRDDAPDAPPRLVDIFRAEFRLRLVIDQWEVQ